MARVTRAEIDEAIRQSILSALAESDGLTDAELERIVPYSFANIEIQRRRLIKMGLVERTGEKRVFANIHRLVERGDDA